jgi:hypothetical protein
MLVQFLQRLGWRRSLLLIAIFVFSASAGAQDAQSSKSESDAWLIAANTWRVAINATLGHLTVSDPIPVTKEVDASKFPGNFGCKWFDQGVDAVRIPISNAKSTPDRSMLEINRHAPYKLACTISCPEPASDSSSAAAVGPPGIAPDVIPVPKTSINFELDFTDQVVHPRNPDVRGFVVGGLIYALLEIARPPEQFPKVLVARLPKPVSDQCKG